ncbi:MAG: SMI1/KNR4 family protein [Hyphomicrobiaceae bacterium]
MTVRQAVAALKERDQSFKVFGSDGHRYRLNAPLSETTVARFEKRYSIQLPKDYRAFLVEVGNGGAGPYYGMFKLGEMDAISTEYMRWKEGCHVGTLRDPWPHTAAWNLTQEAFVAREREARFDDMNAAESMGDDARQDSRRRYLQEYDSETQVAGAFPICHQGCALRDWLVVTGSQAGRVWHDSRTDGGGLSPYKRADDDGMTFTDWYLDWLNTALSQFGLQRV